MKKYLFTLVFLLIPLTLAACGGSVMHYDDALGTEFNQNLFYRNDLKTQLADPSVIYITEGEEAGYYYLYGTTDALGAAGVYAYRTKNFNHWQLVGPAFVPQRDSWAIRNIWAPEVIYMNGKYYMYYSGSNRYDGNKKGIGVAVADSPAGPFVEYEGTAADGRELSRRDQAIVLPFPAIDASPFVDKDGQLYLYFSRDQVDGISSIWGARMKDEVTIEAETLVRLAEPSFRSMEEYLASVGRTGPLSWECATSAYGYNMWNEAPFMYEKEGAYFLTYSANPFWSREYAVGYAVGQSPLGPFVKPDDNRILGIDSSWDHVSGTGHHSFFPVGNQLYIAYHTHIDRVFGNSLRAIAIDEVFIEDKTIHVNGPTYSVQPLPEAISGYKNLAATAAITATGSDDDVRKLNDGRVAMHLEEGDREFSVAGGKTRIKLSFEREVVVRAVMVYNSVDYERAFFQVKRIKVGNLPAIKSLRFNDSYINREFPEYPEMRPGGAFVAEFAETRAETVIIEIDAGRPIAISEIIVLGREG